MMRVRRLLCRAFGHSFTPSKGVLCMEVREVFDGRLFVRYEQRCRRCRRWYVRLPFP
jgi:hypothetical protein